MQVHRLKATIVSNHQKQVLTAADLGITKCGTVNLELAPLNISQVAIYRLNPLNYWIGTKSSR